MSGGMKDVLSIMYRDDPCCAGEMSQTKAVIF